MVGTDPLTSYDGVACDELARRLGVPRCLSLARAGSVLDLVHRLAEDGAPDGTAVLAEEQVAGRGRQGRRWLSPPGSGIWLGYLKRPGPVRESGILALRVGMVVRNVLERLGVACWLKWPNDIFVCDRKLGGVLCEARWSGGDALWVAVGIGLNTLSPLPPELSVSAIALDEVLPGVSRIDVLEKLMPKLCQLPVSHELTETEMAAYADGDWLQGRKLSEPLDGTARGIAKDGALLVETKSGIERVVGGSVVAA
jgi:BirA family biotin operon repressor/biotin-[acetyl-CoA-carboxylase] ligase